MYLNLQVPHKEIRQTAREVRSNLWSAKIARGYIMAYRIAAKMIESGGQSTFLWKQEFQSSAWAYYYDTPDGVVKATVVVAR